ncbi:MAG TPA: DUF1800 family protein [Xanthobacteraceae bacterium]|jgi:uncharacterized protein (DUF1800 family)|nr:DUF1800 family protein [Xanthobacteraceae bacterium]
MALDPQAQAALALHRFGLGPRADAIAKIASDPRGALLAELDRPRAGRLDDPGLMTSAEAAQAGHDFRQEKKAERQVSGGAPARPGPEMSAAPGSNTASDMNPDMRAGADAKADAGAAAPKQGPGVPQQIFLAEATARTRAAARAEIGFAERLVWFWSNHFCVSAAKGAVVAQIAGAYEREAIRPHVLGRFADMLLAVETHPAMLLYLDNARSIGPDSPVGRNGGKGLNENLAREIMELHTLGVRTVYSQADVTRFADVITGWSIVPPRPELAHAGEFIFRPGMHEPAPEKVIDRVYPNTGFEQGRAVLQALAHHPATAKHVATKLVRHFVADDPPLTLVDALSKHFLDTDGDLKEMAKKLVAAPEAWAASPRKLKRPSDWMVGMLRAAAVDPTDIRPIMQAQTLLGEPLWRPPAPNGFADTDAAWIDGMGQRLDIATQAARRFGDQIDPTVVLEQTLGPLASAETRATIKRAESRSQALALLFMAPEFQRR